MFSLQLPLALLHKKPSSFHSHKPKSTSSPTLSKPAIFKLSRPLLNCALSAEHALDEEKVSRQMVEKVDGERLPAGLRRDLMPKHVAVIMDGNSRWARAKGLPTSAGHEAGVRALRKVVECCCKWGVKVLTVFAFSSENWFRSEEEINFLMSLFERVVNLEIQNFVRVPVQSRFSPSTGRDPITFATVDLELRFSSSVVSEKSNIEILMIHT